MANTPYIDLVKPAGTDKALISVLNANSDKIDSAVGGVQDALAIVCNGNTHGAITSGQYVYVRAHDTLQEGLYTANSNIAANATLSSSNLTANSSGGLNALNEQIANIGNLRIYTANTGAGFKTLFDSIPSATPFMCFNTSGIGGCWIGSKTDSATGSCIYINSSNAGIELWRFSNSTWTETTIS